MVFFKPNALFDCATMVQLRSWIAFKCKQQQCYHPTAVHQQKPPNNVCIPRMALIFLQIHRPLSFTQTPTTLATLRWKRNRLEMTWGNRVARSPLPFYPFKPLCQLKRLYEQNLWPLANDCFGKIVSRFSKTIVPSPKIPSAPSSCLVYIHLSFKFLSAFLLERFCSVFNLVFMAI